MYGTNNFAWLKSLLLQQAQGRVHVQPAAERLPQSVGSLGSSDATDFGALFPTAATTHMHNQGLANIWQQQPATKPGALSATACPARWLLTHLNSMAIRVSRFRLSRSSSIKDSPGSGSAVVH